jgi:hypothetical protein
MSPEEEAQDFIGTPADPAEEPISWSPMGWIANQATAAVDVLKQAGGTIIDQLVSEAKDVAGLMHAAFTGEPPAEPGPLFEWTTGLSASVNKLLPEAVKKKLGTSDQSNIAGYVTLADGRVIPVPKAEDTQGQGERALSSSLQASLTKANAEMAATKSKERIETQKLAVSADQFAKNFALKERQAGQQQRLFDLQETAMTLAYDRQRYSPAQLALWGIASTAEPTKEAPQRVIRAIGSGVPRGVVTAPFKWSTE